MSHAPASMGRLSEASKPSSHHSSGTLFLDGGLSFADQGPSLWDSLAGQGPAAAPAIAGAAAPLPADFVVNVSAVEVAEPPCSVELQERSSRGEARVAAATGRRAAAVTPLTLPARDGLDILGKPGLTRRSGTSTRFGNLIAEAAEQMQQEEASSSGRALVDSATQVHAHMPHSTPGMVQGVEGNEAEDPTVLGEKLREGANRRLCLSDPDMGLTPAQALQAAQAAAAVGAGAAATAAVAAVAASAAGAGDSGSKASNSASAAPTTKLIPMYGGSTLAATLAAAAAAVPAAGSAAGGSVASSIVDGDVSSCSPFSSEAAALQGCEGVARMLRSGGRAARYQVGGVGVEEHGRGVARSLFMTAACRSQGRGVGRTPHRALCPTSHIRPASLLLPSSPLYTPPGVCASCALPLQSRAVRSRVTLKLPHAEPEQLPADFLQQLNAAVSVAAGVAVVGATVRRGCVEITLVGVQLCR